MLGFGAHIKRKGEQVVLKGKWAWGGGSFVFPSFSRERQKWEPMVLSILWVNEEAVDVPPWETQ